MATLSRMWEKSNLLQLYQTMLNFPFLFIESRQVKTKPVTQNNILYQTLFMIFVLFIELHDKLYYIDSRTSFMSQSGEKSYFSEYKNDTIMK